MPLRQSILHPKMTQAAPKRLLTPLTVRPPMNLTRGNGWTTILICPHKRSGPLHLQPFDHCQRVQMIFTAACLMTTVKILLNI